jgi:hypothetical protein
MVVGARFALRVSIDCLGDRAFGVDWMRKALAEARQRSSRFDAVAPKMGAWAIAPKMGAWAIAPKMGAWAVAPKMGAW